jgi:hypothetical protein
MKILMFVLFAIVPVLHADVDVDLKSRTVVYKDSRKKIAEELENPGFGEGSEWVSVKETNVNKKTFVEYKIWSQPAGTSVIASELWWVVFVKEGNTFRKIVREELAFRAFRNEKVYKETKPGKTEIKLKGGKIHFLVDGVEAKNTYSN